MIGGSFAERDLQLEASPCIKTRQVIQDGSDAEDALCCKSFSAKEPLIIGLFSAKEPLIIGLFCRK